MLYDICFKTTSEAALIDALAPFGLTFPDELGRTVLAKGSHEHALAYVGRVVATPAEFDPEAMAIVVEETYLEGEYAILRADGPLIAQIAAAPLAGVEVLSEPPARCPTFGDWQSVPVPEMQPIIVAACDRIDALAESLRNQVVTPGSAQMACYQRKETQARAYLAALEAGALSQDADVLAKVYPAVVGEVGITAGTVETVARVIVAKADAWWGYGDAVEAVRLAGKRAVEAAETPAAVTAAEAAIVWPAMPE